MWQESVKLHKTDSEILRLNRNTLVNVLSRKLETDINKETTGEEYQKEISGIKRKQLSPYLNIEKKTEKR